MKRKIPTEQRHELVQKSIKKAIPPMEQRKIIFCMALSCANEPVPDFALCDFHLDRKERGEEVKLKDFSNVLPTVLSIQRQTDEEREVAYRLAKERKRRDSQRRRDALKQAVS